MDGSWRRATGLSPSDFIDVDLEAAMIIDLEPSDDEDVQVLPSMPPIHQGWNRRRRNQPRAVYQAAAVEVPLDQSDMKYELCLSAVAPDLKACFFCLNSIHGSLSEKEATYCERYFGWIEEYATKKNDVGSSSQTLPTAPSPSPPKEPFTCPVCISEVTDPCSTHCGHIFCQSCISLSIQKWKQCPTCRQKLTMKSFHRVYLP